MTTPRYSEFEALQHLGERFDSLGTEGPAYRRRIVSFFGAGLAVVVIAVTPAGAEIGNAVYDLTHDEPTTSSVFFGDTAKGGQLSEVQQRFIRLQKANAHVVGGGTTPSGTRYELIAKAPSFSGAIGVCALVGFEADSSDNRDTETCIGPTVRASFASGNFRIFPSIYRGPTEGSKVPTPVVIGLAPAEAQSIRVTYRGENGERVDAASDSATVETAELLAPPGERHGVRLSEDSPRAFTFFAAFLPSSLDSHGPGARQPEVDFHQIEITAYDGQGKALKSMRMDGRFAGDSGIVSFG